MALQLTTILLFVAIGLTVWAQFKVKGSYNKWSKVQISSGITGAEVARRLLDNNGLYDVPVEPIKGKMTDHYDPSKKAVRLSEGVYFGNSVASVSIASHEVGHAIQHKEQFSMLVLRGKLAPVLNFTSGLAPLLLIAGFLLSALGLIFVGIIFYASVVAFQVVTLPVEFNASSRAKDLMISEGFIRNNEEYGVSKMLNAAAFTYVAAALVAALELVRYILIFVGMNRD